MRVTESIIKEYEAKLEALTGASWDLSGYRFSSDLRALYEFHKYSNSDRLFLECDISSGFALYEIDDGYLVCMLSYLPDSPVAIVKCVGTYDRAKQIYDCLTS